MLRWWHVLIRCWYGVGGSQVENNPIISLAGEDLACFFVFLEGIFLQCQLMILSELDNNAHSVLNKSKQDEICSGLLYRLS